MTDQVSVSNVDAFYLKIIIRQLRLRYVWVNLHKLWIVHFPWSALLLNLASIFPFPSALQPLCLNMPPYVPLPYASKFGNLWVRLKYVGSNDPPSRDYVAEELLFQSSWVNPQDIYSFISLPNRREFELCFLQEAPLRRFLEIHHANLNHPKWKEWSVESSVQLEVTTIVVKFWTGRVPDQDIELYLQRYCEVLQPPVKPVDKFGLWYGVRKFKVRMRRDESGHIVSIPNSISLGPFNGRIIYPGQANRCFICQCWKCGELGHKAKECQNDSECSLCGLKGHTFFKCPKSFANITKAPQQPSTSALLTGHLFWN
uniref:CCHC-type domain-containing protein n=1 Tax=Oreochromis aureus TaxID=47969 RepID=A0AAZ1X802_OREAU